MNPLIAEEFLQEYGPILEKARLALTMVSLVLALMQCYFGYRFLRFWISVVGFIAGFLIGLAVSVRFLPERPWYIWAIAAAAAVLLAVLSYKIYLAGVFFFTGLLAAGAVYTLMHLAPVTEFLNGLPVPSLADILTVVLCAAAFILVGILGVKFSKPFIIVITSVSGAVFASRTLTSMLEILSENELYQVLAFAALAATGILLQHLMNLDRK